MYMFYRFEMLDADQVADRFAAHHLFQHSEIRRVTEHMRQTDDLSFFFGIGYQATAFLVCLCDRFFKEDIISQVERFHTGGIMQMVGGSDNDGIGKLGTAEHFFPGGDTVFPGYMVFVTIYVAAQFHQLGNAGDLQIFRVLQ